MKTKVEIVKGKDLSKYKLNLMAREAVKEFDNNEKPLKKEIKELRAEKKSIFFFIKDNGKIKSFGLLKPVKINYLGKNYNILGMGKVISIEKKKGYGTILVKEMVNYARKKQKTLLGFTIRKTAKFYEKCNLEAKRGLGKRFFYDYGDPKTNKEEQEEYGIYIEGKDKFISKVLRTKSLVHIPCMHW